MKRFPYALILLALLAGCGPVTASKPLPAAKLSAGERTLFEGTWVAGPSEHDVFTIHFVCDGLARVASVAWDGHQHRLVEAELTVSHGKQRDHGETQRFLSMRTLKGKHASDYLFMRFQFLRPDEIVLWPPVPTPYLEAVKHGKLKGKLLSHDEVRLTDPEALLNFIDAEDGVDKFRYQEPAVLRKVADAVGDQPPAKCK